MQLEDYIDEEGVLEALSGTDKNAVLAEMVDFLVSGGCGLDREETLNAILDREKLGSTGVGEEVAIPHAKLKSIEDIKIVFAICREGVEFDSSDGKPVKIFFLVLAPEAKMNLHLKTLARISRLIKTTDFKARITDANSKEEMISILKEEEAKL